MVLLILHRIPIGLKKRAWVEDQAHKTDIMQDMQITPGQPRQHPEKGQLHTKYTEWLYSGKGNQGKGKGGKGDPSTRTVAHIQTYIFVPTPSTRNSKCGICEKEGSDFRHGYLTCAY